MTLQSDQIAKEIKGLLDSAAERDANGTPLHSALLSVRTKRLFDDWRCKRVEELEGYRAATEPIIKRQSLRIKWFEHLLSHGDGKPPIEASDIQRQIFAECACQPTSWEEAKAALDLTEEFRAGPRRQLQDKIEACRRLETAAVRLLNFLAVYQPLVEKSESDRANWNANAPKMHEGLEQYVNDYNDKLRKAYDC